MGTDAGRRWRKKRRPGAGPPGRAGGERGLLGGRGAFGVDFLGLEGDAVVGGEERHEGGDGAAGKDEADEEQDRAEEFVPLQVHEDEDHQHEFDEGEDDQALPEHDRHDHQLDTFKGYRSHF